MSKKCILILGGARSGKSSFAQHLASQLGEKVLFVATAAGLDEEMKRRIEEHQKGRPKSWRTLESLTGVGKSIAEHGRDAQVVIVDCVTLLINNVFEECKSSLGLQEVDEDLLEKRVTAEMQELIACIGKLDASFVIVSNEVGTGLVPVTMVGRTYRDLLGKANQELARRSDQVYLMIAAIPIRMKPSLTLGNLS